jgi:murein L,D-transpeptidase YcbB/YkuD
MAPEQKVQMTRPVPVYLTYLTVVPSGSGLAYYDDIYRWDQAKTQMMRTRRR